MPVGRLRLAYLGRKLNATQDQVVLKLLADRPKATAVHDDEIGTYVDVSVAIVIPTYERAHLLELKNLLDEILEECKDDKRF